MGPSSHFAGIKIPRLLRLAFSRWRHVRGVPRILWWLRYLTFPRSEILVETPDGLPAVINREDYGQIMLYYFPYCSELLALLADIIRSGDICLDLGANVGLLSAYMSKCTGEEGKVIAVEPNPAVAAQLMSMAAHFFPERLVVVQAGIAAQDGSGALFCPADGFSDSIEVTQDSECASPIALFTVDTLVERYLQGHPPNFIKSDIEGGEIYLLDSMRNLLAQGCRPTLLIEFHPQKCEQRGVTASRIAREICSFGYLMRGVLESSEGYRTVPVSFDSIGHDNLLFVTPENLSKCISLALKWN